MLFQSVGCVSAIRQELCYIQNKLHKWAFNKCMEALQHRQSESTWFLHAILSQEFKITDYVFRGRCIFMNFKWQQDNRAFKILFKLQQSTMLAAHIHFIASHTLSLYPVSVNGDFTQHFHWHYPVLSLQSLFKGLVWHEGISGHWHLHVKQNHTANETIFFLDWLKNHKEKQSVKKNKID